MSHTYQDTWATITIEASGLPDADELIPPGAGAMVATFERRSLWCGPIPDVTEANATKTLGALTVRRCLAVQGIDDESLVFPEGAAEGFGWAGGLPPVDIELTEYPNGVAKLADVVPITFGAGDLTVITHRIGGGEVTLAAASPAVLIEGEEESLFGKWPGRAINA